MSYIDPVEPEQKYPEDLETERDIETEVELDADSTGNNLLITIRK